MLAAENYALEPATGDPTRCDVCYLDFPTGAEFSRHQRSTGHQEALALAPRQQFTQAASPTRVTGTPAAPGYIQCDICRKDIHVDVWVAHATRHTSHQQRAAINAALAEAEKDKNGISISGKGGIDLAVMELSRTDESSAKITLLSTRLEGDNSRSKSSASLMNMQKSIERGTKHAVSFELKFSFEGQHEYTLDFTFRKVIPGSRTAEQFVITRQIRVVVGSPDDHERLKPTAPYSKAQPKAAYRKPRRVIRVTRPSVWSYTKWKVTLPEYRPPEDIIEAAFGPHPKAALRQYVPHLSLETYSVFFQALLWIEEEQMRRNLAVYAMTNVALIPHHPDYELEVKELGEGRPPVIVGDLIMVKHSGDETDTWYEGCVHQISGFSVRLRFNDKFNAYRGAKVDVKFLLNRLPDRRMHQAVSSSFNPPRLLFPRSEHTRYLRRPSDCEMESIALVDRALSKNREQLETIAAVVNRPPGSVPFIVFGPPGTGKTVTIVEAIRQILTADPDARILACAPSNAAADLIAVRLAYNPLNPNELFRLNSYSRSYKSLAEGTPVLTDFSLYNDNHVFAIPSLEKFLTYRVIVSTCISAGTPHGIGVKRGHFTHIFLDEAGQASEPMSMIPIKTLADDETNVVPAGDIRQLNPIVHSPIARDLGLKQSYLQRLMNMPIYDEKTHKGQTVTKLVKHFRSHPDILTFPNRQFYGGELLPCADPAVTHSLLKYEKLPAKNFPIVFHGTVGKDQREASSPSFFNIDEITIAKDYLVSLLENRKLRITAKDVGIIAPYHAQCQKMRSVLPQKFKEVKVGSVEEFQGQERRVIIIMTVRSSTDYIPYDMKHTLGFVADPKRFNVAITRARSLLVVVGNPRTLSMDPMWREWLNFVHQKGGWRGKEPDWDTAEPVLDGGYGERIRTEAEARAEEMIQRIRAQYLHSYEQPEEGSDDDSEQDPQEYWGRRQIRDILEPFCMRAHYKCTH
ncbi:uncharacterized protein PHACADRAFT_160043 [Phanerochaete carnosa HHB-10118-sp]|uniref:RNA helicase n=1 Tax=Phanerochaete carnosa (strain HHB-10118-sp) TaxID=650164 RepID=K5VY63_PHACS|nr:uncharacterized protein PHACADRAFT_160043 [Phanerochaete carnosa HHB-10118-sp]EKM56518.1 hypothetical protein PHACADRAFT_160043 [Phanerochaete carnosa HHB-10118-sp]